MTQPSLQFDRSVPGPLEEERDARVGVGQPQRIEPTGSTASRIEPVSNALTEWLKGRGWTLRRDIEEAKGWTERFVRALADASGGEVISGDKGYRLTREATEDERTHAKARLGSQVAAMDKRIKEIEAVEQSLEQLPLRTAA